MNEKPGAQTPAQSGTQTQQIASPNPTITEATTSPGTNARPGPVRKTKPQKPKRKPKRRTKRTT